MTPSAKPENPFAPRSYGSLERVTDRVWIWRNIVNSAVFVGDRGLAIVDTQVNHALARRLRTAVERQFAKPILYAINTHYHWDHTSGNAVFK
ncbi:MAG: MBL fold metallo-hydrolase, partial [Planctomycetes bacterium]|nr:MBL fold metallo-hydrolase [Planctomycetota bacterium]